MKLDSIQDPTNEIAIAEEINSGYVISFINDRGYQEDSCKCY